MKRVVPRNREILRARVHRDRTLAQTSIARYKALEIVAIDGLAGVRPKRRGMNLKMEDFLFERRALLNAVGLTASCYKLASSEFAASFANFLSDRARAPRTLRGDGH